MESTYEIIKELENTTSFLTLLKRGLIPISIFEKKVFYEYYMDDVKKTKSPSQSAINTAEEYGKSESTIWRAIRFMEIKPD